MRGPTSFEKYRRVGEDLDLWKGRKNLGSFNTLLGVIRVYRTGQSSSLTDLFTACFLATAGSKLHPSQSSSKKNGFPFSLAVHVKTHTSWETSVSFSLCELAWKMFEFIPPLSLNASQNSLLRLMCILVGLVFVSPQLNSVLYIFSRWMPLTLLIVMINIFSNFEK